MSIKYLQEKARYSGVGIFNWYYLSSPPQIPRGSRFDLEIGGLVYILYCVAYVIYIYSYICVCVCVCVCVYINIICACVCVCV
jgi:hypothetical protein